MVSMERKFPDDSIGQFYERICRVHRCVNRRWKRQKILTQSSTKNADLKFFHIYTEERPNYLVFKNVIGFDVECHTLKRKENCRVDPQPIVRVFQWQWRHYVDRRVSHNGLRLFDNGVMNSPPNYCMISVRCYYQYSRVVVWLFYRICLREASKTSDHKKT